MELKNNITALDHSKNFGLKCMEIRKVCSN